MDRTKALIGATGLEISWNPDTEVAASDVNSVASVGLVMALLDRQRAEREVVAAAEPAAEPAAPAVVQDDEKQPQPPKVKTRSLREKAVKATQLSVALEPETVPDEVCMSISLDKSAVGSTISF